jgi:hypothetical protein
MASSAWPYPALKRELPNLTPDNSKPTSGKSNQYNCIAWAAGDAMQNWWPDSNGIGHWPEGVTREETIDAFVEAYRTRGFEICVGGVLESGVEKIALYGIKNASGQTAPTHAALQLPSGAWTSKLGPLEDIEHEDHSTVDGPVYGTVVYFMSRARQ